VLSELDRGDPARRLIAIDGKTSRRTGNARTGQRALHTLSAYAREQRLVLAQEMVDGKSNEGAMIPSLLDKLRLKGSLVTVDAAGCYRPIAEGVVEAGGDYLLTVKANQPTLLAGIKAALARAAPETVERHDSEETAHGRLERRRCTVAPAPAGLGGKTPWAPACRRRRRHDGARRQGHDAHPLLHHLPDHDGGTGSGSRARALGDRELGALGPRCRLRR
jgi:predicted transposase YbfD/YdcC